MSTKMFDNLHAVGTMFVKFENDLGRLAQLRSIAPASWSYENHRMAALEQAFAGEWVRSGEIVYSLSHSLAALFALTSAPELDLEHAPHAAFIVQVPRVFFPLPGIIEPESSYLYVHNNNFLIVADWDTTAFAYVMPSAGAAAYAERMTSQSVAQDIQEAELDRDWIREEARRRLKEDLTFGKLPPAAFESCVDAILEGEQAYLNQVKAAPAPDTERLGRNLLAMRFLANTLAYLAASPAGAVVAASSKAQRRPCIMNLLPPREVVVTRAFRDAAKDAVTATLAGSRVGIRRALKHHVRGHWRNQAVGPAHSERRRTWIHPHERGSLEMGAVVRRIETLHVKTGA